MIEVEIGPACQRLATKGFSWFWCDGVLPATAHIQGLRERFEPGPQGHRHFVAVDSLQIHQMALGLVVQLN